MSIVALNWAMKQMTDGPSAQAVLFVIADRSNEHGVCRHADPDTLAKCTRQSRATVFRRLEEMERVGLVVRLSRHLDDGRREYEVRLNLGVALNYGVDKHRTITLYELDDERRQSPIGRLPYNGISDGDQEVESQIETEGGSQIETEPVSPVRLGESHSCDSHMSPSKNPDSPPYPPPGGVAGQSGDFEGDRWPGAESWPDFERAWQEPILRQSIARRVWAALAEEERALAVRAAAGYVAWRRSQKKPPNVINAHTFLRERDSWAKFVPYAPPDARAATKRVLLVRGDPAWRGLCVVKRLWTSPDPRDQVEEDAERIRGLETLSALCDVPVTAWDVITTTEHQAQAQAWRERLALCGYRMPAAVRLWVAEETTKVLPGGKTIPWKTWIEGWRVPSEWPPRMNGTASATGPPEAA